MSAGYDRPISKVMCVNWGEGCDICLMHYEQFNFCCESLLFSKLILDHLGMKSSMSLTECISDPKWSNKYVLINHKKKWDSCSIRKISTFWQ